MTDQRYELSIIIGPCTEQQAHDLAAAILDLPEADVTGAGAVEIEPYPEDDERDADA